MPRRFGTVLVAILLLTAFQPSCQGSDSGPTSYTPIGEQDGGGSFSGGAGTGQDGAGSQDAGPAMDAAGMADGEAGTETPDGGEGPRQIEISREDFFEFDLSGNNRIFDHHGYYLAAGPAGFALAYQAHDSGTDCTTRVDVTLIGSLTEDQQTRTVVNADAQQCSLARDPAIAPWQDDWRLAWTDNRGGTASLYQMDLGTESEPMEVTGGGLAEHSAQIMSLNGKNMLAWITEPDQGPRSITTSMLGQSVGAAHTVVGLGDGRKPDELALAPAAFMMAALGWMDLGEQNRGFYFQLLDGDGEPRTSPELLSEYSYSGGSLDITSDDRAGAMVYSISIDGMEQIRFRSFDLSGIRADERKIVSPPAEATDASVAWFGAHGYLVAYRALSGPGIDSPRIRMVAVDTGVNWDPDGLEPVDVADAAPDGGRTTIRMANDGTVMIAWLDAVSSEEKVLKAVRLR